MVSTSEYSDVSVIDASRRYLDLYLASYIRVCSMESLGWMTCTTAFPIEPIVKIVLPSMRFSSVV